jgi:hypothetical protein
LADEKCFSWLQLIVGAILTAALAVAGNYAVESWKTDQAIRLEKLKKQLDGLDRCIRAIERVSASTIVIRARGYETSSEEISYQAGQISSALTELREQTIGLDSNYESSKHVSVLVEMVETNLVSLQKGRKYNNEFVRFCIDDMPTLIDSARKSLDNDKSRL